MKIKSLQFDMFLHVDKFQTKDTVHMHVQFYFSKIFWQWVTVILSFFYWFIFTWGHEWLHQAHWCTFLGPTWKSWEPHHSNKRKRDLKCVDKRNCIPIIHLFKGTYIVAWFKEWCWFFDRFILITRLVQQQQSSLSVSLWPLPLPVCLSLSRCIN